MSSGCLFQQCLPVVGDCSFSVPLALLLDSEVAGTPFLPCFQEFLLYFHSVKTVMDLLSVVCRLLCEGVEKALEVI